MKLYWPALIFAIYGLIHALLTYNQATYTISLELYALIQTILYASIPALIIFFVTTFLPKNEQKR